jgi:hypothetical protein
MHVKILRDRAFQLPGHRHVTYDYKAGKTYPVKKDWAEQLIADGDAEKAPTPKREAAEAGPVDPPADAEA